MGERVDDLQPLMRGSLLHEAQAVDIPKTPHLIHEDKPEACDAAVLSFLGRHGHPRR
jgi:pimeloyl-ACP methyl ester carboxylesterase